MVPIKLTFQTLGDQKFSFMFVPSGEYPIKYFSLAIIHGILWSKFGRSYESVIYKSVKVYGIDPGSQ